MSLQFERKHFLSFFVVIIVLVAVFTAAYFLVIKDKQDILTKKETELSNLEEQLSVVEARLNDAEEQIVVSSTDLQRELPVEPLVEQLMLSIDRAELISKVEVSSLSVGGTEEEVVFPKKEEDKTDTEEAMGDASQNFADFHGDPSDKIDQQLSGESAEEEKSAEANETTNKNYPYGMKMVKVNLNAEAPSFFELEKFIEELQSLERIIRLDNISFSGPQEVTNLQYDEDKVDFQLALTAFYFPKLPDLIDQIPKLNTPNKSNKRNPFANFSLSDLKLLKERIAELEAQAEREAEQDSSGDDDFDFNVDEEENNGLDKEDSDQVDGEETNNQKNDEEAPRVDQEENMYDSEKIHIANLGESLWSIARDYYGAASMKKVDLIMAANPQIKNPRIIFIGQKIKLPEINNK